MGGNEQLSWRGFCILGLGGGGIYDFFIAELIFKIGSLNLFSTEPTFRYGKILKYEGLKYLG